MSLPVPVIDALCWLDDVAHRVPDPWHRWLLRWWLCNLVDLSCGMTWRELVLNRPGRAS